MGELTELLSPPFPENEIVFPIPVTFYEALQTEVFWETHFRHHGMLKLKPDSASYRSTEFGESYWQVVKGSDLEGLLQSRPTSQALAALLELTPDLRIVQSQQFRSEAIQFIQAAIAGRREQVTLLIAEAELYERSKGDNILELELLKRGLSLMDFLEGMLITHEKIVNQLLQIEATSRTVLVGTYQTSVW